MLVFFVLYPAAWEAPAEVLGGVASYAISSAEGGHSGPTFFNGEIYPTGDLGSDGWAFYPLTWLWRSTPLTLIGTVAALLFWRQRKQAGLALTSLAGLALLFALMMTLGVKKFDRYLLPSLFALMLIAGWGWARLASWIGKRLPERSLAHGALALALGVQAVASWAHFPYFLTYYNPMLGGLPRAQEVMLVGWGEGLDQAAGYLNERGADEVASWYSTSFNLLYEGFADHIPITADLTDEYMERMLAADYLVIYVHQHQRQTPADLLALLEGQEAVKVIQLQGVDYAWIYQLNR